MGVKGLSIVNSVQSHSKGAQNLLICRYWYQSECSSTDETSKASNTKRDYYGKPVKSKISATTYCDTTLL